jgi:hypothetical protein
LRIEFGANYRSSYGAAIKPVMMEDNTMSDVAVECAENDVPDEMVEVFARKDDIIAKLKAASCSGVITIHFGGSGDEGSVHTIDGIEDNHGLWRELEDWTYEIAYATGVDWYNEDGGDGKIEIDLNEGVVRYEISVNEISSHLVTDGTF